jgi:hypothetical protein
VPIYSKVPRTGTRKLLEPWIGWSGPHVPHGVPTRRRATCGAAHVLRMDPTSPALAPSRALTPMDGLRNARALSSPVLPVLRRVLTSHGPFGQRAMRPIAAEIREQQQRQKRSRFAGFHGGRVSATIVVSVCMLSLLSVAVGANGLGQARSRVARLARLLAEASHAGCRRAASSTTKTMLSSRLVRTARAAVELL